jgi:hypothetical protein
MVYVSLEVGVSFVFPMENPNTSPKAAPAATTVMEITSMAGILIAARFLLRP